MTQPVCGSQYTSHVMNRLHITPNATLTNIYSDSLGTEVSRQPLLLKKHTKPFNTRVRLYWISIAQFHSKSLYKNIPNAKIYTDPAVLAVVLIDAGLK